MYEASFMTPNLPNLGQLATPFWGATSNCIARNIPSMGNQLKFLRKGRRLTQEKMAELMSMSTSGYIKLENGDRELSASHIQKAASVFEVSPAEIISDAASSASARMVPIVGLAGAGPDGSVLFAAGDGNYGEVPAPLDSSPTAEALEVRGSSMYGLANDGWILFYDERVPPSREHLGEPCVCWLPDGRVLVKIPQPSSTRGLYNLESTNAPTMRDQVVESMALITDIKTRKAATRFVRRNPEAAPQNVRVARG